MTLLPDSAFLHRSAPWRAESRALIALAVPLVMTGLAAMAITTTDVVMMGWLGPEALAAGSLGGHFYSSTFFFGMGVVTAVAPLVAQALGGRRYRLVRRSVRQGFWAGAVLSVPLCFAIWHTETILTLLGQNPETAAAAGSYLRAHVWGFPSALGFLVLAEFLAAHSRPRAVMAVSVCAVGINAVLNYGFMFGNFGFPRLELVGAGVSSAIVDTLMFLALLSFVYIDRRFRRYRILGRIWRADWPLFREVFRIGLPIAFTVLAETGLFLASSLLIGLLGTEQLAGHAIAIQLVALAFMVPYGVGQAATVRVGLAFGSGDWPGVERAGWTALSWGCGFAVLPAGLFWFAAPELVDLFLDLEQARTGQVAAYAATFLTVAVVFQFADAAQVVAMGSLRGLKDTRVPLGIAVLGYWVFGISVAVLLGFALEFGGSGIWLGLAIGLTTTAVLLIWRFRVLTGRLGRPLERRSVAWKRAGLQSNE
ncbi:MAG: MATE family efflux transporter [Kiloniellales bacterium]|nr:MATE family efflux transporter [Kiloniellales bacterium]